MYTNRDVVLRCIIAAFLKELSDKLSIFNVHSETNIEKVPIPMYYALMGQELPYIEDFLDQTDGDCGGSQIRPVPRGVLTVEGISINQQEETGWAQVNIPIELDGVTLSLHVNDSKMVPIKLETSLQVIASNHIELLKIIESAISRIWPRSNMFKVNCLGFPIEATFQPDSTYNRKFPIDITKDTTDREYSITFSLELASVVPVFEYGVSLSEIYYIISRLLKKEDVKQKILEHPVITISRLSDGSLGFEVAGIMDSINVNLIDNTTDEIIETSNITG